MTNLLERAIKCGDSGGAAKIIMDALGIKTDDLANHCLKDWPTDRISGWNDKLLPSRMSA